LIFQNTPFYLSHQGLNDFVIQSLIGQAYATLCPQLNYISPRLLQSNQVSSTHLRVGFISSHFYDHSIGRILSEYLFTLSEISILTDDLFPSIKEFEIFVFFVDETLQYNENNWRFPFRRREDKITHAFAKKLTSQRFIHLPDNWRSFGRKLKFTDWMC